MAGTLDQISPPVLPMAGEAYQRAYHDQLNNVQRIFYNRLTNAANTLLGRNGAVNLQAPHAMLMSDQDQANAGVVLANALTYNQPVIQQGIEVRSGSQIWFEKAGQYLVTFSLQVTNRSNTAAVFEVWAAYNGTNYPLSNTRFDIPARKSSTEWSHIAPAVSGIFTVASPDTDYLSLKWWSDNIDVFIEHYPGGVNPTRPAIPSVILTANFISRLP